MSRPPMNRPPGREKDDADYSLRRNGFGLAFWLLIAFGFFCIIAGLAVSRLGPALFPVKPPSVHGVSSPGAPLSSAKLAP